MIHAAAGEYPRQQPSDKPLTAASAAHTPSSRRLHCRFAFMDCDRCLQALCSKDRVWLPRPVQKHAQEDRFQNVRCWTWSLELARPYSDIMPSTYLDAQSVLVAEIWSSKTFTLVPPRRRFCTPQGSLQRWSRCLLLTFPHLRPLSSAVAFWARPTQVLFSGARCNVQGCSGVSACRQPTGIKKRAPY